MRSLRISAHLRRLPRARLCGKRGSFCGGALLRACAQRLCLSANGKGSIVIGFAGDLRVQRSEQQGSGVLSANIAGVPDAKVKHGETLARVSIFAGLSEPELAFLSQRSVPRRFSPGETVFSEGEPCTGLYVVESGHVRIFNSSAGGREQVLSIEGPGSSVAELPVF